MKELNYVLAIGIKQPFSADPLDSDLVPNSTLMSHLVGTLTTRTGSGRYEPFLAESWQPSDDSKTWSFDLRSGLLCEDGSLITADEFRRSLQTTIKIYHRQRPSLPVIEDLVGFAEFVDGSAASISGLNANGGRLIFEFAKPTRSGVLEFLSMPYYGFFPAGNFTKSGQWKDSLKIVSSGSYKLESIDLKLESATLVRREGWFSNLNRSPQKVVLWQKDLEKAYQSPFEYQIVTTLGNSSPSVDDKIYYQINAVPEVLLAITLSPFKDSIFKDVRNRRYFHRRLRQVQKSIEYDFDRSNLNPSFYTQFKSEKFEDLILEDGFIDLESRKSLSVYLGRKNRDDAYIKELIEEVFRGSGIELEYVYLDNTKEDWIQRHLSNSLYDIRVAAVGIGGGFQHWLTKMMFCSNLGISFPDPGNRICKLVDESQGDQWDVTKFARDFNRILAEESAVIPLIHTGFVWHISKNIDASIAPISAIPRFDLMEMKQ